MTKPLTEIAEYNTKYLDSSDWPINSSRGFSFWAVLQFAFKIRLATYHQTKMPLILINGIKK